MSEYSSCLSFATAKCGEDVAAKTALLGFLFQLHSVRDEILAEYSKHQAKANQNIVDPKIRELIEKAQSEGLTLRQYQEKQAREFSERRAKESRAPLIPTVGK